MIPVYHQHQQATKYEEKKQFFRKSFLWGEIFLKIFFIIPYLIISQTFQMVKLYSEFPKKQIK